MQLSHVAPGACVTLTLAIASCQFSEMRYLARQVGEGEVVGVWQMNPASMQDLRDVGYEGTIVQPGEHRIEIREDGSCHFDSIVGSGAVRGYVTGTLDAECEWSLGSVGHQALELDIKGPQARRTYFYFDEDEDGALVLWIFIADPDMWRYLEYVKVDHSQADESA